MYRSGHTHGPQGAAPPAAGPVPALSDSAPGGHPEFKGLPGPPSGR